MQSPGALNVTTPTEREIMLSRAFDAPREVVFDALTRPEQLKRWLFQPSGWNLKVCEIDLRVGGSYHFVWRSVDGETVELKGAYLEVVAPERSVNTESYGQPWYPGEAIVTTCLAEEEGRTVLTGTLLYESREARDTVLESGLEKGTAASYDRLARLLRSLTRSGPGRQWLRRTESALLSAFGRPA